MLAFIDEIVIPFLNSLYGAVGYLGVMIAMAIESAMIPLPSELILPYAGFLVSDPSQIEPLTGSPWNFWIVVIVATIGNTIGSLIAYAIGAYGGRPFLERYGKYLLIRPHEIELADGFFQRHGGATVFIGRLLPIVRTFISFPAGVARMRLSTFILYSTAGAFIWSAIAGLRGNGARRALGRHPARPAAVRPAHRGRRRRPGRRLHLVATGHAWQTRSHRVAGPAGSRGRRRGRLRPIRAWTKGPADFG